MELERWITDEELPYLYEGTNDSKGGEPEVFEWAGFGCGVQKWV
jgi:hypothetical protein